MDGTGRVIADGHYQYRYSAQGQLTQVLNAGGEWVAKYAYDTQGQRIAKAVNTQGKRNTTHYLWERGNLVAEVNEQGQITAQYFYLNEESQGQNKALPIAKWESADSAGNESGKARMLMIHTDHRGMPMAMTNEAKVVVWRGQFNVWGQSAVAHPTGSARQAAELNLRLPGQYFDAETGLHDNRWRTYNPANGLYLQPDPMPTRVGYAQGYNPYLYVGGDPLNKIDPLGLYSVDTHYYTTFFLALVAGVSYEEAKVIALATQYIDDNPETKPLPGLSMPESAHYERLKTYHFTMWAPADNYTDIFQETYNNSPDLRNYQEKYRAQLNRLERASTQAPTRCAQLQLFGEYLHAFEDTYGHRDRNNIPIDLNGGLGHALYGEEPDKTYNGYGRTWPTRESRALVMQEDVFKKMTSFSRGGALVSWGEIKDFMAQWNKIEEDGNEAEVKRQLFNEKLKDFSIRNNEGKKVTVDIFFELDKPDIAKDRYLKDQGRQNRLSFLCALNQSDFPGTILPTKKTSCK